jgi:hypothetical protein
MKDGALAKVFLTQLRLHLTQDGFRLKSRTFVRDRPEATQMISFQTSVSSTQQSVRFTLNLGIYLRELAIRLGDPPSPERILDCHWQVRIGTLVPESNGDSWWTVSSESEAQKAADNISQVLRTHALPPMEALSNKDPLCDLWRQGKHPGIFAPDRDIYIKTLCDG